MKALLKEANMVADELAKIQPNTIVEDVIRRLATELRIQRQHYDKAIGLNASKAAGRKAGTEDSAKGVQLSGATGQASGSDGGTL